MKPPSIFKLFLKELKHDYFALAGLILFSIILLAIFIGAPVINYFYDVMRVDPKILPVSPADSGTLLGLDSLGRNQFHLLFVAARNSLYLAFGVTFFSFLLGATVGVISGFYGGKIDSIVMRITDTWSMIPFLMVVIVLLNIFGKTVFNFIFFLTIFTWVTRARLLRAAALAQRNLDYINASKTLGTPNLIIIIREMLPNLVDVAIANLVLTLAANIGIETGLSLLGFGLGWNYPSLGVMMQNATNPMYLQHFWWVWAPSLVLVVTMMLCVNFVGNALQRVSDPKQRRG
ncbi:MAG: ABC transporter permease [Clostridiales bacterium]|jgi:peptide/nickel transport system permease protein|nr:ABC transporter permease [Clostridiales bacterium]